MQPRQDLASRPLLLHSGPLPSPLQQNLSSAGLCMPTGRMASLSFQNKGPAGTSKSPPCKAVQISLGSAQAESKDLASSVWSCSRNSSCNGASSALLWALTRQRGARCTPNLPSPAQSHPSHQQFSDHASRFCLPYQHASYSFNTFQSLMQYRESSHTETVFKLQTIWPKFGTIPCFCTFSGSCPVHDVFCALAHLKQH